MAVFTPIKAPALHAGRQPGPIRGWKRRYILTADQSEAGSAGIFSRRTNQRQEDNPEGTNSSEAGTKSGGSGR
eukprot:7653483-Pyramimonas_sp.AAC.1